MTWVLFIIYLAIMIYFLFLSDGLNRRIFEGEYHYNLKPFYEIKRSFYCLQRNGKGDFHYFMINVVMNVAAFIPFGFMVPVIRPARKSFWHVLLLSLELTMIVELLQLVLKAGTCDIDDIIMNTLGGIIGYFFYAIGYRIYKGIIHSK